MKKRIIICGYPKSGNTWLTRLTAEILRCPVVGFWCYPLHNEESIEGIDRESEFQCFKAHQTFEQMRHTLDVHGNGTEKIIYIYRDPRSVTVSASHYFRLWPKDSRLQNPFKYLLERIAIYLKFPYAYSHRSDLFARALIEGTTRLPWLEESWDKHVMGYQNKSNVLNISYEYLRTDSLAATREIAQFLSIDRSDTELEEAVRAQSFSTKKKQFQIDGKGARAKFLRKGRTDSWRDELPASSLKYIEQKIGDFMRELGYELSSDLEHDVALEEQVEK